MKSKFILLLILTGSLSGCRKDALTDDLTGRWERVDNRNHVITFGYEGNYDWLTLLRGYIRETDGSLRPYQYLGEYKTDSQGDSIAIHWMHSSSTYSLKYYFSFRGSEFEIGDLITESDSIFLFKKVW